MSEPLLAAIQRELRYRALPGGGFADQPGGLCRPDATAWAILAFRLEPDYELLQGAQASLAAAQLADGRVPISPDHPESHWPTSLAILAWESSAALGEHQRRAAEFLLATSGTHWLGGPGSALGHNPDLKGWPWVDHTHSWIGPTAFAILALRRAGYGAHPRVAEATRLIQDRQLAHGGWNYGNTIVFGTELRPMPEDTGLALTALKNSATGGEAAPALAYLAAAAPTLTTPRSLAWTLMGLDAWGARPAKAPDWLAACWERRSRYGGYDTTALAMLALAVAGPEQWEKILLTKPDASEAG